MSSNKWNLVKTVIGVIVAYVVALGLYVTNHADWWIFVLVAAGTYPWLKYIIKLAHFEHCNPVAILRRTLPKCGFEILEEEWDDECKAVRFTGRIDECKVCVEANPERERIDIIHTPWSVIDADMMEKSNFFESLNLLNFSRLSSRIIVTPPNEKGERNLLTVCSTVLPNANPVKFLRDTFGELLSRPNALMENINCEKPWLNTKHNPIGFNPTN